VDVIVLLAMASLNERLSASDGDVPVGAAARHASAEAKPEERPARDDLPPPGGGRDPA